MFEVRNIVISGLFLMVALNLGWLWMTILSDKGGVTPSIFIQNPDEPKPTSSVSDSAISQLQYQLDMLKTKVERLEKQSALATASKNLSQQTSPTETTPTPTSNATNEPSETTAPSPSPSASPTPATSTNQESMIYLGQGSSRSLSWVEVAGTTTKINKSNYGSIQSLTLEVLGSIISGEIQVKLLNQTTGETVTGSDLIFNSSTPTWKQASSVSLNPGEYPYALHLKTSNGELGLIDGARLRIVHSR